MFARLPLYHLKWRSGDDYLSDLAQHPFAMSFLFREIYWREPKS